MAMEEDLVTRYTAAAPIAAIVAAGAIGWLDRPRGLFPALVLTKVSPGREWTFDGPDGLDQPRIQHDCWALTKAQAVALARAVLAEAEQQRTVGATTFEPADLELERWPEPEGLEGVGPVFRVQLDLMFFFSET